MVSRAYYEVNLPRLGARVVVSHGVPSFGYTVLDGVLIDEERKKLEEAITTFTQAVTAP